MTRSNHPAQLTCTDPLVCGVQVLHKDVAEDQAAHLARIGGLFDKPQFSDVRVVAADGCGFYCHRAILAACSKPFERAMLTEGTCMPTCTLEPAYSLCT